MDMMIKTVKQIDHVMNDQWHMGDTDQTYWMTEVTEAMMLIQFTV
jgi:hypothetical protein